MYCTAYNERRAIMLISVLVSVCVGVRVFVRECAYVVYVCVTYSRDALRPCAPECARACVRAYVRVRADSNTNQIYLVALISIITAFENHLISYSHIYNFIERRWFESVKEGVGVFRGVVIRGVVIRVASVLVMLRISIVNTRLVSFTCLGSV